MTEGEEVAIASPVASVDPAVEAGQRWAAVGLMIAGVLHEAKNALTGVIGPLQVAKVRLDGPNNARDLLEIAESEALRCRDLLAEYASWTREPSLTRNVRHDVRASASRVADVVRAHLKLHRVELVIALPADPLFADADAARLQQALLNLVLNAQQAMPNGGRITLAVLKRADGVVLAVSDDGPGISIELQRKIFEPYFTTKAAGVGTGLGLAITLAIVNVHGGRMTIASTPGQGATFRIILPERV